MKVGNEWTQRSLELFQYFIKPDNGLHTDNKPSQYSTDETDSKSAFFLFLLGKFP